MSISRVTAAMASATNETSISLANLNFDFALYKVEAPAEYKDLGATISRKRKVDAEEGTLHKTARKLGALFAGLLPLTDHLFSAYGKRVSEISSMPDINPREGSERGGIFASHIGADSASIWAGVTSGSPAIATHLLGCMLARIFTGPEAVSVWVELVQKQKERIRGKQEESLYPHEQQPACVAAQQEISRRDLANWDASARAWLQSADQAKELQHKQTMLILDNASVPVNNEPDTYTSVIKAWTAALEAMNNLLRGIPQRVQDGAALLAISSWHLYPDMIVYGGLGKEVKQKDELFKPAALLTLGLQHSLGNNKSVYWSLPLAHLQYYGHPIQASRAAGQENSRISYQEFAYILLGCLFDGWKDFTSTNEEGLMWIQRIGGILRLPAAKEFQDDAENDQNPAWLLYSKNVKEGVSPPSSERPEKPFWLNYLLTAAVQLTDCEESEFKAANQLMNLGRRRSSFLYLNSKSSSPLFGLSQVPVLLSVLKSDLQRVQLLRVTCNQLKLDGSCFLISYMSSTGMPQTEYASVLPLPRASQKRMFNGILKGPQLSGSQHVRWIPLTSMQLTICSKRSEDFKDVEKALVIIRDLEINEHIAQSAKTSATHRVRSASFPLDQDLQDQNITPERQKRIDDIRELKEVVMLAKRVRSIEQIGEVCLPVAEWGDQQYRFFSKGLIFSLEPDFIDAVRDLLEKLGKAPKEDSSVALSSSALCIGDADVAALYSIGRTPSVASLEAKALLLSNVMLDPKRLKRFFAADNFNTKKLRHHLSELSALDRLTEDEIRNLKACAVMADIYKLLPGATISTLVVSQSLPQAKWISKSRQNFQKHGSSSADLLTLPQAFACVAMFESGTCNLDPSTLSETFAMSSGNSLYVAGSLLCDPYEQPKTTELRRVVGNVGRAGMTFLICPPEVKTREPDPEKWMAINHNTFDGSLENHFQQTSIHLSFTEYEIPLITEDNPKHIIDRAVILVESLISVFEGGTWVAEVDILKAFRSNILRVVHDPARCGPQMAPNQEAPQKVINYEEALSEHSQLAATSVENWDELIEAPCTGVIAVRAHKNWLARLAATALCVRHEFVPVILPDEPCWRCCADIIRESGIEKLALIC